MTSWFIGVKASVISGAPLYSKSMSYLFPVGKRRVLFAKRSYNIEKFGFEPVHRQLKSDQPEPIAFYSMLEHPEGASELIFSLPFMLSKHRLTSAASCFEDLPCLSLLSMSVWK